MMLKMIVCESVLTFEEFTFLYELVMHFCIFLRISLNFENFRIKDSIGFLQTPSINELLRHLVYNCGINLI
jgi:hypothetical protein